jgi:hypothetical protein
MSRPGDRVLRLATRVCTERTRRRLIDPAVADLQSEFAAARRSGSTWRTWWTLGAGYVSIAKVLTIAVCGDLRTEASTWQPEERAGARRGLLVALLTTTLVTGVLVANFVNGMVPIGWTSMALLVPSMLTVSLPLGIALGAAWSFHGARRPRRLAAANVATAALCSMAMFANVVWVIPDANQTFREHALAHAQGRDGIVAVPRGLHELTMPALRARIEEELTAGRPHRARVAEVVYYQRFSVGLGTLPMIGVIVALAFRREWGRGRLTAAALGTFGVYYGTFVASRSISEALAVAPIVTVWAGPALIAGTALLLTSSRSRVRA